MKKSIFLVVLLTGLFSCNTNPSPETSAETTLITELPPIETAQQQEEVADFNGYPFGCPTLIKFVFADDWNIIDHSGTVNMGEGRCLYSLRYV